MKVYKTNLKQSVRQLEKRVAFIEPENIRVSKSILSSLKNLNSYFFLNENSQLCLVGNTESVSGDTGLLGTLQQNQQLKHFSNNIAHSLGNNNYAKLSSNLQNDIDNVAPIIPKGTVPVDGELTIMTHVIGCCPARTSDFLISNGFGKLVSFTDGSEIVVIRSYAFAYEDEFEEEEDEEEAEVEEGDEEETEDEEEDEFERDEEE